MPTCQRALTAWRWPVVARIHPFFSCGVAVVACAIHPKNPGGETALGGLRGGLYDVCVYECMYECGVRARVKVKSKFFCHPVGFSKGNGAQGCGGGHQLHLAAPCCTLLSCAAPPPRVHDREAHALVASGAGVFDSHGPSTWARTWTPQGFSGSGSGQNPETLKP